jgi:glycine C-acetyltransferase
MLTKSFSKELKKSRIQQLGFRLSDAQEVDCIYHSLNDFYKKDVIQSLSFLERWQLFGSFRNDHIIRNYQHSRRVSLSGSGPLTHMNGQNSNHVQSFINLASNDYLNLTKHPDVMLAARDKLFGYGVGSGSVPLLAGTLEIHQQLEKKMAQFKGCEAALSFSSGYSANVGCLQALLSTTDVAVCDFYVHASLIDGCKHANVMFFRHNNMASLKKVLERAQNRYKNILVIVDGVYSMDGDIAPLQEIVTIAHKAGALVYVDEAHATGVIGDGGRGTPNHCGIEGQVDIVSGTFSKALGAVGGFIAGSTDLVQYVEFMARSYMFSTSLPPSVCGGVIKSLDILEQEPDRRLRLWNHIHYFREKLMDAGFNIGQSETAIFPIIIGDQKIVLEMTHQLHQAGVFVNPVLYPAVPIRLSRIRISLTSELTPRQLDYALDCIIRIGQCLGVVK